MDNLLNVEREIFLLVNHIKDFHDFLTQAYSLNDIPYNLSGKIFSKKGEVLINDAQVNYHFHGNGCTLVWNNCEIEYAIDVVSRHGIKIGAYGIGKFLNTLPSGENIESYSFEEMTTILQQLELNGVLMTRKPEDMGSWHVNEEWYQSCKVGKEFTGENKDDIDW